MNSYDKAIQYLARREHSRLELKRKLKRKKFSVDEIDSTLDNLQERNYQNDARFAESYVYYRTQAGYGPLRIIAELRERGVSSALIEKFINVRDEQWIAQLKTAWLKRFTKEERASSVVNKKHQQYRFLVYRGFPEGLVRDTLFSDCEE